MSFRISRSSGIEPSRRRSLSQTRPDHSSSYSDYRTPSSSVVSTSRRPYPSSSTGNSYYSPASSSSSSYLRNGTNGTRGSPYISKYSNYDNGVTTAGLSLGGSSGGNSSRYAGGSNQSLNTLTTPSTSSLYRSHSLREQERKSRSRNRTAVANKIMAASSTAKRSQSCSSEKSEGYEVRSGMCRCAFDRESVLESLVNVFIVFFLLILCGSSMDCVIFSQSGGEESRKSRLSDGSSAKNGDIIDYKALYEAQL